MHGRQAEPGAPAALFGGKERLEQSRLYLRRHAGSGVGDGERHVGTRFHAEVPSRVVLVEIDVGGLDRQGAALRHGIPRIHRQVHDNLLHLAVIRLDAGQFGAEPQHDAHVFADQSFQHPPHAGDDSVQIEHRRLDDLLAAERQQLTREPRRRHTRVLDFHDVRLALVVRLEIGEQQLAESENHGEQIVEIVRHAAGQPSHRLHLLSLVDTVPPTRAAR